MKTKIENTKRSKMSKYIIFSTCSLLVSYFTSAQELESPQTLVGSDSKIGYVSGMNLKINTIQNDIGTLFEIYGGAMLNNSALVGLSGGFNIGHPHVNYGYLGVIGQYTYKPNNLIHPSGQILLAAGSTKDYQRPKSTALDNLLNISGTGFYMIEPGLNLELNLGILTQLVVGVSYRYITGLDEDSEHVSLTNVTNKDMSGLNFSLGVKIRKSKVKKNK